MEYPSLEQDERNASLERDRFDAELSEETIDTDIHEQLKEVQRSIDEDNSTIEQALKRIQNNTKRKEHLEVLLDNPTF